MIGAIIKQELLLSFKKIGNLVNPVIFFFIAISIFSISFDNLPNYNISFQLSLATIWLCLTFSILLGTQNSFKEDFNDGTIEQLFISGKHFELIIAAKIFSNWLIYCLPLILFIPIAAIILKLNNFLIINIILIALIASFIISFITNFCASLILASGTNHSLLTILVLPLITPVIIFANSAFNNFENEIFWTSFEFLLAILIFLTPILIFITSAAIKLNISE